MGIKEGFWGEGDGDVIKFDIRVVGDPSPNTSSAKQGNDDFDENEEGLVTLQKSKLHTSLSNLTDRGVDHSSKFFD